ncbi:hypothetical protein [Vibrio hippocampi]|uniref:Phage protein n=1 Tax=Vibrio hippocampi TaxID=654686 RepID=A0ABM8ZPC7_9VIBR|nr:hypothetical protein [Vibrio hippocampi]CAH0531230.1 hypothetical protein VHP8226_04167 [Vibrio hippocampi]
MTIKAIQVQRDLEGYWTHPDFPDLGENTTWDEFKAYFKAQGLSLDVVWFENDAPEALVDAFFEDGETNIASWEPSKPMDEAFLLSIHDTEEGPLCLWAVPMEQNSGSSDIQAASKAAETPA